MRRAGIVGLPNATISSRWGSVAHAREKGLYGIEGRDYIVQDGDLVHFKLNV
jgi:ribosome-binding ATPase YchF (GTP1/OBG family)